MFYTVKAIPAMLLFLLGAPYASAQFDYVVNASFTATETRTSIRDGKTTEETVALARAKDGSLYQLFSAKGKPNYRAILDDVPNHRTILIDTQKQTYVIHPRPDLVTETTDDIEARIRARREEDRERASLAPTPNGEKHSNLGVKVEDGFTLYGWEIDSAVARKPVRRKPQPRLITHSETWSTDFGLNMSYDFLSYEEAHPDLPATTVREQDEVTDLDMEDPDPALFRIPDGYTLINDAPPPAKRRSPRRK